MLVAIESGSRLNKGRGDGWLNEPKLVQRRTGPPPRRFATLRRGILRLHSLAKAGGPPGDRTRDTLIKSRGNRTFIRVSKSCLLSAL